MAIYLKFQDKRMKIEDIEKLMLFGNLQASICLGNYYAKKRKSSKEFYRLCIDSYLYGAKQGNPLCIIRVSEYSFEFSQILDDDTESKLYYIALSVNHAYKAFCKANTKPLRIKALNCMIKSSFLVENNTNLIIKNIE